jgi:DNA-binding transcriptional MerR regulator
MEYSIGQLAKQAGYAVQTVRYFEETGLMPHPPRTEGGQRRYGQQHLDRLLFIRHARDLGFEVEDIRSLLALAADPNQSCAAVDQIARQHLVAIDEKIARLQSLQAEVHRMIKSCARGNIGGCNVIGALSRHVDCRHGKRRSSRH